MSRNLTLDELKEKVDVCTEELSNIDKKRDNKLAELKKWKKKFADEERKVRTHNLCTVGGMAYNRFGDDISPDDFSEMLDYLFSLEDVKEFVASEKERRFMRDNPSAAVLEESESLKNSADMENPEADNNGISDTYTDTYKNKITDEKTSA